MSKQLADILVKDKIITPAQFGEITNTIKDPSQYVRAMIERKFISETKLLYFLSQKFGIPSINLAKFEISEEVQKIMTPDMVRKSQAIPIQANPGTLVVAVCDPSNIAALDDLKFRVKRNIECVLTSYSAFDLVLGKYFGGAANVGVAIESYQRDASSKAKTESNNTDQGVELDSVQVHDIESSASAGDAPIITLVNGIMSEGVRRGASDIHIEPYEKRFRVRLRIDGTLVDLITIPQEMKRAVLARIKIMSRMDIAETRVPQDGRIKLKAGNQELDYRVNSMPTLFGEKVVLRMLNKSNLQLDLKKLGFETAQLEAFKKGINSANGMVLVTGPTGSGKTTTLYSALSELNQVADNLSTAEDPVEYNLDGINQVQINKDVGLTFPAVLRALLRQDPDIILVGEIRDFETAEVAIQAALTGHLVLSTVHTNDAPSTITRLMNMGLEPFLVVAALNCVVAQRLIRKICPKCKVDNPIPMQRLIDYGVSPELAQGAKLFKGTGCSGCNNTGYRGRAAIYEVLTFAPNLKEMVLRGESILEIKKQAIADGMTTLRHSALIRVLQGVTSLEEALSITMEQ